MARNKEKVIHTRVGERAVDLDKVLYFPRGLIGLEKHREFILLQIRDDSPFLVLQSMSNPRVGLLVADPYSFTTDYEITLGEPERRILKLKTLRQAAVLVTVTIPPGEPEKTALNLTGPILVNHEAKLGLQVPQTDSDYPSHLYLHLDKQEDGTEDGLEETT
ncbi:MAG: flagellar assembly protein FliW [Desulfovibrio sp.]|nr:MAG: flagellar assembly protein FliW [Desulfovibrio sp.]